MVKGCILTAGLAVTGLLVAACSVTPQSAATELAAAVALDAATQASADVDQAAAKATQPSAVPAVAVANPSTNTKPQVWMTPKYIIVIYPNGREVRLPRSGYTPPQD